MLHIEFKVSVKCVHEALVACESFKCDWIYKICCIVCHYDVDIGVLLYKHTRKVCYLVCRYASCHSQNYCFSF